MSISTVRYCLSSSIARLRVAAMRWLWLWSSVWHCRSWITGSTYGNDSSSVWSWLVWTAHGRKHYRSPLVYSTRSVPESPSDPVHVLENFIIIGLGSRRRHTSRYILDHLVGQSVTTVLPERVATDYILIRYTMQNCRVGL